MNKTVKVVWTCFTALLAVGILFIIYWNPRWYYLHTDLSVTKEINQIQESDSDVNFLSIRVLSSKEIVTIAVNGTMVYSKTGERGIHIVILNQKTGEVITSRIFDSYLPNGDNAIPGFLQSLTDDRIVCFAKLGNATLSLTSTGKEPIKAMGSKLIGSLKWRDTWAYVTIKGKKDISGEDVGRDINATTDWGNPINLHVHVAIQEDIECYLEPSELTTKRKEFCSKYEGYNDLCSCGNPYNLPKHQLLLSNNRVVDVPVIIIASNRPLYLYRTLKTLLTIPGANTSLTTVFVDGLFQEPVDVAKLLGVNVINHEPSGKGGAGRTSQNYKASLTKTFDIYPKAKYVIILEEDLEVAPDFFSYFSQTVDLLEKDSSIYCISAWNDQGYSHSCQDPSMLYRIETMPGLGWLLSRKLYKNELELKWPRPDNGVDWDNWMRQPYIRKGRECIIPDVSRTYHFGKTGLHIKPSFQEAFFTYHSVNTVKDVQLKNIDKMTKEKYEEHIGDLLRSAEVLDHSKNPCASNYGFIPDTTGKVYVMYITMKSRDDYVTWMELAKCYHLWTNHPRGYHNGLWRLWLKQNHILVVGVPYSPYKTFKPNDVKSLTLTKTAIKDPALKQ